MLRALNAAEGRRLLSTWPMIPEAVVAHVSPCARLDRSAIACVFEVALPSHELAVRIE